jgi:hypothetical protein
MRQLKRKGADCNPYDLAVDLDLICNIWVNIHQMFTKQVLTINKMTANHRK